MEYYGVSMDMWILTYTHAALALHSCRAASAVTLGDLCCLLVRSLYEVESSSEFFLGKPTRHGKPRSTGTGPICAWLRAFWCSGITLLLS